MKAKYCIFGVIFARFFCISCVIFWAGLCLAVGGKKNFPVQKVCINEMIFSLYGKFDVSVPLVGTSFIGQYGFYPIDSKCRAFRCFICNNLVECNSSEELREFVGNLRKKDYRSMYHYKVDNNECIFSSCYEPPGAPSVSKEYIRKYNNIVHILKDGSLLGKEADDFLVSGYKKVVVELCLSENSDIGWINPSYCNDINIPVSSSKPERNSCSEACSLPNESFSEINNYITSLSLGSKQLLANLKPDSTYLALDRAEIPSMMLELDESLLYGSNLEMQTRKKYISSSERMKTFITWNFPCKDLPKKFVDAGFFFVGKRDLVCCYYCGVKIQDWDNQDPLEVHIQYSPRCMFIAGINKRGGIPYDEDKKNRTKSSQNEKAHVKEYIDLLVCALDNVGCSKNDIGIVVNKFEVRDMNIDEDVSYLLDEIYKLKNYNDSNEVANSVFCNTNDINELPEETEGNDLYIYKTIAKYKDYCDAAVRLRSFETWPTHSKLEPEVLVSAGFFYSGAGDHVRCYFCGIGLRNWEDGDDPVVEHARWFPECKYMIRLKGQHFINLVHSAHTNELSAEALGENKKNNYKINF